MGNRAGQYAHLAYGVFLLLVAIDPITQYYCAAQIGQAAGYACKGRNYYQCSFMPGSQLMHLDFGINLRNL